MKRIAVVGIACVAMLLLAAVAASAALLPEFLVEGGKFPVKLEGVASSGPTRIETVGGLIIECKAMKMTGEITSAHGGTYKFNMENCLTSSRTECNTSGDTGGHLLWSGEFHIVYVLLTTLKVALLMSIPKLVGCLGEFRTHENKGFLVPITPLNTLTTHYEMSAKLVKSGVEEFISYYNESGTLVTGAYLELVSGSIQFGLASSPINLTTEKAVDVVG